jgi:hypothetical protein
MVLVFLKLSYTFIQKVNRPSSEHSQYIFLGDQNARIDNSQNRNRNRQSFCP